jgi:hypothetical protein
MPNVDLVQNHPVQVQLYFAVGKENKGSSRIQAFKLLSEKVAEETKTEGRMNFVASITGFNMAITQNKCCEITQDAIDIFEPLLWYELTRKMNEPTAKMFNERGIIAESSNTAQPSMYGMQPRKTVFNIVNFVDINAVLHTLYGDGPDGSLYQYQVIPVKPISFINNFSATGYQNQEQRWLFSVNRLDAQNVYNLCEEVGTIPGGAINFVTDTN